MGVNFVSDKKDAFDEETEEVDVDQDLFNDLTSTRSE